MLVSRSSDYLFLRKTKTYSKRVSVSIPTTETEVETTDTSSMVINNDDLRPFISKENHRDRIALPSHGETRT